MLACANEGLPFDALTVDQLLGGGWSMNQCEIKPLEVELRNSESGDKGVAPSREPSLQGKSIGTPLDERVNSLDMRRLALELSTPGDHDLPYRFRLATAMPQVLAWTRLLAKVHTGELQL